MVGGRGLLTDSTVPDVASGDVDDGWVVSKEAKGSVALVTEETSELTGDVTVVGVELAGCAADGALAGLVRVLREVLDN